MHVLQFVIGLAVLWLLIEGIRALRTWRKEREFVRDALRPGAGLSYGIPGKRRSFWDFLRFG